MRKNDHNRRAYNDSYDPSLLEPARDLPYDRRMVALRNSLVRELGAGRDVVDLGCGTGSYLVPNVEHFRSVVGVDFSSRMLDALKQRFGGTLPDRVRLLEEDFTRLSLPGESVDLVFSFSSLYYVEDLGSVLGEVVRILRPGGYAVLELGNRRSLNVHIWNRAVLQGSPWAVHHAIPYEQTRRLVSDVGLSIGSWRSFQVLPFSGVVSGLKYLYPIAHPFWKRPMGVSVGGRMLDEWISGLWPLRHVAFRHVVVARRP